MNNQPFLRDTLPSIKKTGLAIAVLLVVALTAHAGDIVIESGKIDVGGGEISNTPSTARVLGYVIGMADERITSGSFVDVPGRSLTFTKQYDSTLLRLSLSDTLGQYTSNYNSCEWRFWFDGDVVRSFSAADDQDSGTTWDMESATHTAIVDGISAGSHTFKVQNRRNSGSQCLNGWNAQNNYMMVEELPQ